MKVDTFTIMEGVWVRLLSLAFLLRTTMLTCTVRIAWGSKYNLRTETKEVLKAVGGVMKGVGKIMKGAEKIMKGAEKMIKGAEKMMKVAERVMKGGRGIVRK